MKFFTFKNFHGSIYFYKWGFSTHLFYLNVNKKPISPFVKMIYFINIGVGNIGDPLYKETRHFLFAFDLFNFKQREGDQVRLHFSIPLHKPTYETISNVESV